MFSGNKDIAGMHIRMKETVSQHLGEKNLYTPLRQ